MKMTICGVATSLVVMLSALGAPAHGSSVDDAAMASMTSPAPKVSYKQLRKRCPSATFDGVKVRQCQIVFKAKVRNVKRGYRISVFEYDPRSKFKSEILTFSARGKKASKKSDERVCSYDNGKVRMKYWTVIRDKRGKVATKTKRVTLC